MLIILFNFARHNTNPWQLPLLNAREVAEENNENDDEMECAIDDKIIYHSTISE